jgi:hypothetical protein
VKQTLKNIQREPKIVVKKSNSYKRTAGEYYAPDCLTLTALSEKRLAHRFHKGINVTSSWLCLPCKKQTRQSQYHYLPRSVGTATDSGNAVSGAP